MTEPAVETPTVPSLNELRTGPAAQILRDVIKASIDKTAVKSLDAAVVPDAKALVGLALQAAQTLEGLGLAVPGPQKLEFLQSLLRDAIDSLEVPAEAKDALRGLIDTTVPWAIHGAIQASKGLVSLLAPKLEGLLGSPEAAAAAAKAASKAVPQVGQLVSCLCVPLAQAMRGSTKANGAA